MLALVSAVWVLAAAPNNNFQKGTELFEQYKYAESRAAFAKARAAGNLSRAELLELLEMTGVAAAQQRQADAAQAAFTELLTLDPEHQLKTDYAPRVMTPFYEARRVVGEKGSLSATAAPALHDGNVDAITVTLAKDPLKQVRTVRFHLQRDGAWTTVNAVPSAATFEVKAPSATWWAELLGDGGTQLLSLGTAEAPRTDAAPKPAPPPPAVAASPVPPSETPVVQERPQPSGGGTVRKISYAVLALALACGGAGGYFGWRSGSDFARISGASTNSAGVLSLTEHDAYVFQAHGQQSAQVANSLFIAAGALAVAGILMWILGGP